MIFNFKITVCSEFDFQNHPVGCLAHFCQPVRGAWDDTLSLFVEIFFKHAKTDEFTSMQLNLKIRET